MVCCSWSVFGVTHKAHRNEVGENVSLSKRSVGLGDSVGDVAGDEVREAGQCLRIVEQASFSIEHETGEVRTVLISSSTD